MRLRRDSRRGADIDVTSFADIAFLMNIFFILTTTFLQISGNRLDIPSGTTDPARQTREQITVNLKGADIFFGDKNTRMTLDELRGRLAQEVFLSRPEEERVVVVDSSPQVPYENYYQVLMAISRAGGVVALIDERGEAAKP